MVSQANSVGEGSPLVRADNFAGTDKVPGPYPSAFPPRPVSKVRSQPHCCHQQHHRHPVLIDLEDGSASIASHTALKATVTSLLFIQCPRKSGASWNDGKTCPVLVSRQTSTPDCTRI